MIVPVSPLLLPRAVAVIERALENTPYLAGARDALCAAVQAPGADGRALASTSGEDIEGVIVFGIFGGTSGAGRLHLVVVESRIDDFYRDDIALAFMRRELPKH